MVALVAADKDWVPSQPGTALYLRPTYIATDAFLGVRPATRYLLYVITSPVGAYYASGFKPVKIWVETEAVRAVRGGIGWAKAAANYVASMKAADDVRSRGYEQVLWLDAIERRYLEEVGTMNLFVVIGDEIATPPLGRLDPARHHPPDVLTLAREWGLNITERADRVRRARSRPIARARCARSSARAPPPSSRASASWATPTAR